MQTKRAKSEKVRFDEVTHKQKELICSAEYIAAARLHPGDFTRDRKMNFPKLMAFMMNLVRTSTQTALDRFFAQIGEAHISMTQQSFSEARQKLNPKACKALMLNTVSTVYAHGTNKWHGMNIVAIDGSKVQLPDDKRLLETFGGTGRGGSSPTAQASLAYDVLNDIAVDAEIEPLSVGEHELAKRHIERIGNMKESFRALIVMDRGYSSSELMSFADRNGVKFLVRLRRKFNVAIDELGLGIHDFGLSTANGILAVKIVKFRLDSGEIETLVTNIADKRMGPNAFKQLYFLRWGIETEYGAIKLKFAVENFSGRTEIAIRQDFFVTLTLSNIVSVAVNEAQPAVDLARADKNNKHLYKVNLNQAVGSFKDRYILALLDPDPESCANKTAEIIALIGKHVVPQRCGRSVPRNPSPRQSRFHHNMKLNC